MHAGMNSILCHLDCNSTVFLKAPNRADNWIFSLAPVDNLCLEEKNKLVEESADVIVCYSLCGCNEVQQVHSGLGLEIDRFHILVRTGKQVLQCKSSLGLQRRYHCVNAHQLQLRR